MIVGLGTDIADISRIAQVYGRTGQDFVDRILTDAEKQTIPQNPDRLYAFLAKRFAVKEAAAKALGTGIGNGVSFHDFETIHDSSGAPSLLVSGHAKQIAESKNIQRWHVSLSDEKSYAVATVIAETN